MFEKLNSSYENFIEKKQFKKYDICSYNVSVELDIIKKDLGYISLVKKESIFVMMGDISRVLIYKLKSNEWEKIELSLSTYYIN